MITRVLILSILLAGCCDSDESDTFEGDSIIANTSWYEPFFVYGQTGSRYFDIYAGGKKGMFYKPTKDSCYELYPITITENNFHFDSIDHEYSVKFTSQHPRFLDVYFPCIAFGDTTMCAEFFSPFKDTIKVKFCQ